MPMAAVAGELGVGGEALTPAISPISLAAVSTPQPGSASSCGASSGDQVGEFVLERVDGAGQLADAAQLVARDPDAGGLLGAREPAGDARPASARDERAGAGLELGPEVVQVPAQVVVKRGALRDEALAMIDEQPDVELGPGQLRRQADCRGLRAARPGRSRSRRCVGLAALAAHRGAPAISFGGTRTTRSPRASRKRSNAPERAGSPRSPTPARRHEAARPHRSASNARRRAAPSGRRALGRSRQSTAATVCERLWVSAPITIICTVPFVGN